MTLPTVSLDSDHTVFANVEMADAYLDAASHADSWRALSDEDTKARYLVTATRIFNRQRWKGNKVATDQPLAFPRENMGITPEPVLNEDDIPVDVVNASIELALALVDGAEVQSNATTADRVHSMSAGSVSITNYRDADIPTRFPLIVQELLRDYLAGAGAVFASRANGVDGETIFPVELGFR